MINEDFRIGGGFAYTARFGKPFIVPILPLNYEKDKHSINMVFPIESKYTYSVGTNEKLKVGFKQSLNGAQFNITTSIPTDIYIAQLDKIRYTRVNVGGTVEYQITKLVQFEIYVGTSTRRRYNLLDSSGKTYQFDLNESPFLNFGLTVVLPKPKKNN